LRGLIRGRLRDQHWAGGQADDLFGDTAHEQPAKTRATVRAQNDEVTGALAGNPLNLVRRVALGENMLNGKSWRRGHLLAELARETAAIARGLELGGRFAIRYVFRAERFDDVDNQQSRLVLPGQIDGNVKRIPGTVREIGWVENHTRLKHGLSPLPSGPSGK